MQVNVIRYSLRDLFEKSKNILVVLAPEGNEDYGSLVASLVEIFTSYEKKVEILVKDELPLAARPLVKKEQIKSRIEPKSLIISFDWTKMQLDKVSYNLEGDKFNLIIRSKSGNLDSKDAVFSYKGSSWDLVVTVGISNSADLITNFGFEEDKFDRLASVNFDRSNTNKNFAKLNIVDPNSDSVCSLAVNAFKDSGIKLPTKAAETLLYGMRTATSNFTQVVDPTTFEAAAYCKRAMIPGMVEDTKIVEENVSGTEDTNVPQTWMSPKIFRSNRVS